MKFSPRDIAAGLFAPLDPAVSMAQDGDHLVIRAAGPTISLAAREPLPQAHWFPRHVLPVIISLTLTLFLRRFAPGSMAAWADIEGQRPVTGENIAALDGLRGLAAVMVVADHTLPLFKGVGTAGVLLAWLCHGTGLAARLRERGRAWEGRLVALLGLLLLACISYTLIERPLVVSHHKGTGISVAAGRAGP